MKVERPTIPTGRNGNGIGGGVEVRTWENWEDLEDKAWVRKDKDKNGKMEWTDLRYRFFADLRLAPDKEPEGLAPLAEEAPAGSGKQHVRRGTTVEGRLGGHNGRLSQGA